MTNNRFEAYYGYENKNKKIYYFKYLLIIENN